MLNYCNKIYQNTTFVHRVDNIIIIIHRLKTRDDGRSITPNRTQ